MVLLPRHAAPKDGSAVMTRTMYGGAVRRGGLDVTRVLIGINVVVFLITVSSGAAYRPLEGWSSYCAGKAGLAMLTRSLVLETNGIRIFGFSPGTIDTDMQVKIRASGMNMISQIPRANLSPVEHAVRGLVYLCDDASDDLAGQDVSMRDEAFRGRIGLG